MKVAGLADLMNGDDVRMIKRGDGLGFPDEAAEPVRIARSLDGQQLERHLAVEARILSQVNFTHPAGAERRENLIMAERLTDEATRLRRRPQFGGDFEGGRIDQIPRLFMLGDERTNFCEQ